MQLLGGAPTSTEVKPSLWLDKSTSESGFSWKEVSRDALNWRSIAGPKCTNSSHKITKGVGDYLECETDRAYHVMEEDNEISKLAGISKHLCECLEPQNLVDLLKDCADGKDLHMGTRLHTHIAKMGLLEVNIFVGNTLISMYAKCGSLVKAQELCNIIPIRNVVSWNALISGYAQHQYDDQALICFEQMQHEGVSPNAVTFACALKACGNLGDSDKGQAIHAQIVGEVLVAKNIIVGNALIDMYAKCRLLAKAQEVFDKLPIRDVVSWNALLGGYALQGQNDQVVDRFHEMKLDGVFPDLVTFICILKGCDSKDSGQKIHVEIIREGLLEKDFVVGSALVDMYISCSLLEKAQEVLYKLPTCNIVAWNALIAAYVEYEYSEQALQFYEMMKLQDFILNTATYIATMKACGKIGALQKGREIHAEVIRDGLLERDIAIGNAMVDMYTKCGSFSKAEEVFDKLPLKDVVLWNALISGYAQHGHGEDAFECFRKMQLEGFSPDAVTFISVLNACGIIKDADRGNQIHSAVVREGLLEKDIVVGNALVEMCGECGLLSKAQQVFDKLPAQNIITWNSLIGAYVQHGHSEEALNYFVWLQLEGISPNIFTYVGALKACTIIGDAVKGQGIHTEVLKNGLLEKDVAIGNALVDMYAKCGMLEKAQGVFDEIAIKDVVLWNVLIASYAQHGHCERALQCFGLMQSDGLFPDTTTFTTTLKICGHIGNLGKGQLLHCEIVKAGLLDDNSSVGNALIEMYMRCNFLAKGIVVLSALHCRDEVSWNAIITGFTNAGFGEQALKCFKQMQLDSLAPSAATFVCILKACSSIGIAGKIQGIHADIIREGLLEKDFVLCTALVDAFQKCGSLQKAQEVFDKLSFRNNVLWNALLSGYSLFGKVGNMLYLFDKLIGSGIRADCVTFSILLNACSYTGLLDMGQLICKTMLSHFDVMPALEHFTSVVDLFGRTGWLSKAIEMIKVMPFSANTTMWHIVLGACRNLGNLKLGRVVFEQSLQLCMNDASAYICMSNIYADAIRQENI